MIPITDLSWQTLSWQELLKNAVSDIKELCELLDLPPQPHYSDFPLLVPLPYLSRIDKGNLDDPLLKQILPSAKEDQVILDYVDHPLEEAGYSPIPGLLQKYQGRALVITSGACAINCRYCFRRHFPYQDFQPNLAQWNKIAEHISADTSIEELILSGGDPLMMPDRRISDIIASISQINHVKTLRIHTRMPVVLPQRITRPLLDLLENTRLNVVVVNHINHAQEIDQDVDVAMSALRKSGVILLNQSVLLAGINDSADSLINLSKRMFSVGILPYYLHLLDKVKGAAHFDINDQKGLQLIEEIKEALPGYLVPKLVREVPSMPSKQAIT
ncbi:MAG: EF-P beta-lysylation protein EpmB [Candidatus Azotimanducaceae bacterium]|jgi:EF-P beta-lysylation protein EpmB